MPAAPDSRALVRDAWKLLRPKSKVDFYRRLGLDAAQATQRLRRVERGGPLHYDEAWAMLETVGLVSVELRPVEIAERLVTRLDAGDHVPRRELERVAAQVERVAETLPRLVERLREGARAGQQVR